jgi:two-component system phosphate regulon sensor histidine kinase PhoR
MRKTFSTNAFGAKAAVMTAAVVGSLAPILAWVAGYRIDQLHPMIRAIGLVTVLGTCAGFLVAVFRRIHRNEAALHEELEALCRLEHDANNGDANRPPIGLPEDSPCYGTVARLRGILTAQAARLSDAEHAKALSEVRCRRAVAEHQRLADIVAGIPEPIVAVDQYDEVLLTNRSAEELLAFKSDDVGTRVIAHIDRCERLIELLNDTSRRKLHFVRNEEVELEDGRGQRRWYSVALTALGGSAKDAGHNRDGSEGAVAVLRDISKQRQLQKQHADFVSSASHEMKAPLTGIKAYVELLADAPDESTREEFVEVINSQTDRLQRLIENLLNVARVESGVVKVDKRAQPLNEILTEALNVVTPMALAKQLTLVNYLSPLYLGVLVDRDLMLQAAINLLSNAVKYTAPGGKVTLRSRSVDKEVQFEVEDTGVGLSPEDSERIFEKFYRVDKDKNMAPGTGLGLPLAKYIVEHVHNGRLTVTSQLGVGSTFAVTLQVAGHGT